MARKSLERQAEMGPVFDATLDGEDGAPVEARRGACGADGELVMGTGNRFGRSGCGGSACTRLPYVTMPKVCGVADVERTAAMLTTPRGGAGWPVAFRCAR
jgi:citrate lyase subunit beta/citryl-CoA lyase